MKMILPLATAAFVGLAAPAHATMLDIGLGATSSDVTINSGADVLDPDQVILGNPNMVLNHNSTVVAPPFTLTNFFVQPGSTIYGNSYLSVFGLSGPNFTPDPGMATYTLVENTKTFGFTWGTIDDYNILTLTDSRGVQYTIGGAELLATLAGSTPGTTQTDVMFSDPFGAIKSAVFQSYSNSFEVANLQDGPGAVPLPASLPLFGSALLLMVIGNMHGRVRKFIG